MKSPLIGCVLSCIIAGLVSSALAEEANSTGDLKELVNTKVYTVSKQEEDAFTSPSALYVLSESDLKQMGVRHIADALRAVPGLQVAKITSNKWMVAARGFGEQFSNKLLVLIDGRPVYTAIFSGVLWNQEDVPIQDIKQIEVIRGPGATLWGSNAVNGVINIITKSSQDTLGTRETFTTGFTDDGDNQTVSETSYGQPLKDLGTARATLKLRQDPSNISVAHTSGYDDSWKSGSLNLRFDSTPNPQKSFKMTGSAFRDDANQTYTLPTLSAPYMVKMQGNEASNGGHIQGEYTKAINVDSSYVLRSYIDYTDWHYATYVSDYTDYSVEGQYNTKIFGDWEVTSGAGYKLTYDTADNTPTSILSSTSNLANFGDAFLQTKIPLNNKVFATIGSKIESNSYNPFSLSPNVRLSWHPAPTVMTWTSWSKAVRIPSRNTFDLTSMIRGTSSGYLALLPSENFRPEKLESYEAGIRLNPLHGLQLDTSLFYNQYDDLRTFIHGAAQPYPITAPLYISNQGNAETKGIEISSTYQTSPRLRLNLAYTYQNSDFSAPTGTNDPVFLTSGDKWAKNTVIARESYLLSEQLTFNTSGYYYSSQPAMQIPSYTKLDSNLSWEPINKVGITIGVDNLLDSYHPEYSAPLYGEATQVSRLFYITLRLEL